MKSMVDRMREWPASRWTLGFGGILVAAIGLAAFGSALSMREHETAFWEQQLEGTSLVIAEHARQTMTSSQAVLDGIVDQIDARRFNDAQALRVGLATPEFFRFLRERLGTLPQGDVATVVAVNGDVVNFSRSYPAPSINLADRDYFKAQAADPSLGKFISVPVRNRGNGKWTFYLSRRIDNAHGTMIGLALIGISVDAFSDLYERVGHRMGEGAAISLFRRDFVLLTRWPKADELIGLANRVGAGYQIVEREGREHGVERTDTYRVADHAPVDRIVAARVVDGYSLVVVAAVTADLYLASWRQSVRTIAFVAGAAMLLLAGFTAALWRVLRAREAQFAENARLTSALRASDARAQLIIDTAPDGMLVVDSRGRVVRANLRVESLFGAPRAALIGQPIETLIPERLRVRHGELREAYGHAPLARKMGSSLAIHARRHDGSEFPADISLGPMHVDGELFVVVTVIDLTVHKQAETLLRRSEQALLQTQAMARLGGWNIDFSTGLCTASRQAAQNLGLAITEFQIDELFRHVHRDDRATVNAAWDAALRTRGRYSVDHRVVVGGFVRWLHTHGEIEFDEEGTPVRAAGMNQDITEVREAQIALEGYKQNLETIVVARTAELEAARREAERLLRVKSDFLASMSHEIRTPLNAVLGFAELGRRTCTDHASEIFDRIQRAGQLLLGNINDILDLSKIEAGKLVIESGVIDLARLLDDVRGILAGPARDKGIELRVEIGAGLPARCTGDTLRIQQVLVNLVSNAIKFTERGSVVLYAGIERGDTLILRVTDTGTGIAPENIGRLFQPFEQFGSATTRRYGGTGLGLSICKRLVDLMRGRIEVQSQLGAGSVFEVRLPLAGASGQLVPGAVSAPVASPPSSPTSSPSASEAVAAPIARYAQRLSGVKVLAAEDVEVNRLLLEELLAIEGAQLRCVEDGPHALEAVRGAGAGHFDIVLTDIQMPGMDGYALTQQLHDVDAALPVIGLTAYARTEDRERCLAAGMVDHVAKPIDIGTLVAAIQRHARHDPKPVTAIDWPELHSRVGGSKTVVDRLVTTCLRTEAQTAGQLRNAVDDRDFGRVERITHNLKSLGGNMAARRLADLATRALDAARHQRVDAFALAAQAADALDDMIGELAAREASGVASA